MSFEKAVKAKPLVHDTDTLFYMRIEVMNKNIEEKALSVIQDFNKASQGLERQAIIITYTDNDNITTFNDGDANSVLLTMANSLAQTLSEVVVNLSKGEQHGLIGNVCNEIYSMAINKLNEDKNNE